MLKNKKNIAMAMAVATVATSVAPAFAATLDGSTINKKDEAKIAELKAEINGYLKTKYTTDKTALLDETKAGKCAYEVTAVVTDDKNVAATPVNILSSYDLDKMITLLADGSKVDITVKDLGHSTVDGKIVDAKVEQYKKSEATTTLTNDVTAIKGLKSGTKDVAVVQEIGENAYSVKLLNNDKTLELKVGSNKIMATADGVIYKEDAYGNKLDKDGKITTNADNYVVLGFKNFKAPITGDDIQEPKKFTVEAKEMTLVNQEYKVSDLYNAKANILTTKGNELSKFIENAKKDTKATIAKDDELSTPYKLVLKYTKDGKSSLISISGSKEELATIETTLKTPGVGTIAGMNRRETAIEVSKAAFETEKTADSVVLVSDLAIADGLAATPFAAQKNAPILLTNKDGISEDVMKEINRVMKSNGKVYLIGGETVLSEGVEKALDSKYISYERIAGANRQETSLKIAQKMDPSKEVFITGRFAEADAMSVANIAATKKAPIILTHENGLTKEQAKFVKDQADTDAAYIVGGEAKINASIDAEVKNLVESKATVKRFAGERRQETNAKVIKEFYQDATAPLTADTVYVAKSDDKGLVDALPAGVLASSTTALAGRAQGPVVLATDKLDASQEAVLNKLSAKVVAAEKKQVGYGIASTIWETINKIGK